MMKILLINTLYAPNVVGGAERSVQFLAESLVQHGDEVVVVSTFPGPGIKVDWLNGVKVYYIGLKNVYWPFQGKESPTVLNLIWHALDTYNVWMVHEVSKILDVEKPALVHTNNLAGFSVLVWQMIKKRRLPLVHTLRDYYLLCPRSRGLMYRKGRNCEIQCQNCKVSSIPRRNRSSDVDVVVGISRYILEKHLRSEYFAQTPVQRVIYNAYDTSSTPLSKALIKGQPLRIGFLGRVGSAKGIEYLLDVLKNLPGEAWKLHIGGKTSEEYETFLRSHYSMPNIYFLGFVKPEVFFSQIDVLVVPSLWQEPLGRTVLEAYAHGVPVIGSNRGGIPEIIEAGRTGLIFDVEQPQSLTDAITQFIDTPHHLYQMGQNAYAKSNEFSLETILQAYLDAYKAAINFSQDLNPNLQ